jgi:orotidine-5'-phosphate decarboxylase
MDDLSGAEGFSARLARAVAKTGPLCAGIDPSAELLAQWDLSDDAEGLHTFGMRCIEAFSGVVPIVKPQVAFFERFGSRGIAALESILAAARAADLMVIGDAKRGDIGTTSAAYASAWLDPASTLRVDAVTVAPYMGLGALRPIYELAAQHGLGVIVVVRSSNPEGRGLQLALTEKGRGPAVEDMLLGQIAGLNHGGELVPGTVGAVIGATLAPSSFDLSTLGGTILAPGVGAQGGTAKEVAALFAGCPAGSVVASASRSLLSCGPGVAALAAAARSELAEMADALS